MNIARFFVDRPIFAAVLSIIIFVAGLIALPILPITEYPEVVPPTVQVRAIYPGANPKVVADAVATPLEEVINGVENMSYMKSVAGSDGTLLLTVTFRPGTDVNMAQVEVQNRVSQALPRLPEDVRRLGVTTQKRSPNLTMVVHLTAPDGRYDMVYLRNYVTLRLRDEIARIHGVGDSIAFGAGDYSMRVWLDPPKLASRGLTAGDVLRAIREQNVQVSAGLIGGPPNPKGTDFSLSVNAQGQLVTTEEFGDIVLKHGDDGQVTRLRDVARLELGASEYSMRSFLDNKPAAALGVFQAPGSNVVELSDAVRARMVELAKDFPPGIEWTVVYDPTIFIKQSIRSVVETLFEAALLVVLVVILFLQSWRASIIPLLAVPVSIVGTFGALLLLGFSVNTLTLFGLVLAIGIVVDDAIVVVENIERNIEAGLAPKAAAHQAMREVSGPIIAIALVLCAVFVPMAFLSGVTGQFYRQFAVTIAISTVISAINSLTLSPALAAALLKPVDAPKDRATRIIDRLLGFIFRPFNRLFYKASDKYSQGVGVALRHRVRALILHGALIALTVFAFRSVPGGFIPTQDKLYLFGIASLPEGASLDRTDAFIKKMSAVALATPGVAHTVALPGLNPLQGTATPNAGALYVTLTDPGERKETGAAIAQELSAKFAGLEEGMGLAMMPPPILGIGTGSGFSLYIQDRGALGYGELEKAVQALSGALMQEPGIKYPISSYQPNVPQLELNVDRTRVKAQGVALTDVFETMQVYLGSAYVNDFLRFGRNFRVMAQADASFRQNVESVSDFRVRSTSGAMVPLGSLATITPTYGPDPVVRYNGYPAADLMGTTDPRILSSAGAIEAVNRLAPQVLPVGMSFEWTDLSYQQVSEGRASLLVFPLALLLVFLVLSALYESWILPLSILLIVPLCVLAAMIGVKLTGGDNNVFVQVGLVVLMGLASKNAILIVEFARDLELQGRGIVEAAIEACRLRLRPIVMTSFAFIAGVVPLVNAHGAGSEVRHALGVTVLSGMLGVTLFGLFLTPVFYVVLRRFAVRREERRAARAPSPQSTPSPESGY